MPPIDFQSGLIILIITITVCFSGGALAGIISLKLIRANNFLIKIFRLLIGAIGGYEAIVILNIFLLKDSRKNLNEILKLIIDFHKDLTGFFIPAMFGAIGASIAIFVMRKGFHWRS
ncbi:MAG: hypothetical protein IGS49_11615 [Chlorogloeopsis fritschii C42_A2020_084]|uniref:hypothetical protein n=1 Tax=Chlorogloeopsis fritschii TaxID=1124 RepID=UPI0019EDCEB8|nr:hypothetical protein [Chlorogloeopsis fritschii]MBF2006084.1 hypothetical protein [Chlorogloeopsis fritschii C42_A2020_084]